MEALVFALADLAHMISYMLRTVGVYVHTLSAPKMAASVSFSLATTLPR